MNFQFSLHDRQYEADLSRPIDISIPLRHGAENPNCFWAPMPDFSPVVMGDFTGSTAAGAPVNFFNVFFNPHGNGTHTECVGHIARERYVLHACLREFHFGALLASVYPQKMESGDRVITASQIRDILVAGSVRALVLRTLPNDDLKMQQRYSGANPPYLEAEALRIMADCGIEHLLVDLPSVDREEDGGALAGHRAFWRYPEAVREHCTITEMVYVPNEVPDGLYLLNLQTARFDLDASPSRPILFEIRETPR